MFKEEREETNFRWQMIGNIQDGRPNLGSGMEVAVYRMMQYSLRDVMIKHLGVRTTDQIFFEAGELAGREFCKTMVPPADNLNAFFQKVQDLLKELRIGIVRIEELDETTGKITLTVSEDLDCSGLPPCEETICTFDEGFLSGLATQYTGQDFSAKEIDCWCSGERVCRFVIGPAT